MPPVNFLLGSKTYRRDARKLTLARREIVLSFLTETYELPKEGTSGIISALKERGYSASAADIYHDKGLYRQAFLYLTGDEEYRNGIDRRLQIKKYAARLYGVACLRIDKIMTMQEAVRLAEEWMGSDALRAPEKPSPTVKPAAVAQVPLRIRDEPTISEQTELEQMFASALDNLRGAMEAIITSWVKKNLQLERRITALEAGRTRDLQVQTAAVQAITERIETQHTILQGFPQQTVSKENGGLWEEELTFEIEREFNKFLKTIRHTGAESQLIKAVQTLGVFGPSHNSLQTKKMFRRLRGIPKDVEWYYYSRAADDIRFTWVAEQEKIRLLAAYPKQEVE